MAHYTQQPNFLLTSGSLLEHMTEVGTMLDRLVKHHGYEPDEVQTKWHSDEYTTGWRTIVRWPVTITLETRS